MIESLETRALLHGTIGSVLPTGTIVPWVFPPISTQIRVSPLPGTPGPRPSPPNPPADPPVGRPPLPIPPTVPPPAPSPPPIAAPAFSNIDWSNARPSPIVRAESLRGVYENRLYVFGGFSSSSGPIVESHYYEVDGNHWISIRPLPERITHAGVAQTATDAYFVGGYVGIGEGYRQAYGSPRVWRYNFVTDTYARIADLPARYAGGGAEVLNGQLHYFGGYASSRADTNVHLTLDLSDPAARWQAAPSMPTSRNHMGHAVFGGRMYAIAGQTSTDEELVTQRTVEVFDPVTQLWTPASPIPRGVSHVSSATFVMGDRIIVAGGESAHNVQVRDVWAYAPAKDTWEALTPLPGPRFSGVAAAFGNKIIFATGGSSVSAWIGNPEP